MDITIIESTKSYNIGHFFGKFLNPYPYVLNNAGLKSLSLWGLRCKTNLEGFETDIFFAVKSPEVNKETNNGGSLQRKQDVLIYA